MQIFLIYVRDENFSCLLPKALDRSPSTDGRVKVMAFPPLGIQTLAPILRQHGHQVRMFDMCHPQMKAPHIAAAVAQDRPHVIAISFLSTTTYPATKALDTFCFNRLCVYRGTPLWREYVERGIIDDQRDWAKWFKCSDIDSTILPGALLNRLRMKGYARLFAYRLAWRPVGTYRLLRLFSRHMKTTDLLQLLASPFRRRTLTRRPDLPARMIDQGLTEPVPEAGLGLRQRSDPELTEPGRDAALSPLQSVET